MSRPRVAAPLITRGICRDASGMNSRDAAGLYVMNTLLLEGTENLPSPDVARQVRFSRIGDANISHLFPYTRQKREIGVYCATLSDCCLPPAASSLRDWIWIACSRSVSTCVRANRRMCRCSLMVQSCELSALNGGKLLRRQWKWTKTLIFFLSLLELQIVGEASLLLLFVLFDDFLLFESKQFAGCSQFGFSLIYSKNKSRCAQDVKIWRQTTEVNSLNAHPVMGSVPCRGGND